MKTTTGAASLFLAAALLCGCVSHHIGALYHAGDEKPPEFLIGPTAGILTNIDGFSATLTAILGPGSAGNDETRTHSGEVLGRGGRLIFQPATLHRSKKDRKMGGLFFIWDENKHGGFVISDALQGYAAIKSDVVVTNETALKDETTQEEMDGHPCHRSEAVYMLSNGTTGRLTIWRADDLKHFPVRMELVNGLKHITLVFTDLRFELPPLELFSPPEGFTFYANSVGMMNELIMRESALAKKYDANDFQETTPSVIGHDWHPPGAQ